MLARVILAPPLTLVYRSLRLTPSLPPLSSSQRIAFETLVMMTQVLPVCVLDGPIGTGRSLVLQHLHRRLGGKLIDLSDELQAIASLHPAALEDGVYQLAARALRENDLVIFDGFRDFQKVVSNRSY